MTSTIQIKFSKSYESRLRRLYAITLDDFVYIVEFQQGSCPICLSDLGTDMSVDHDHLGAFNLSVSEIHRKLSELTLIERRKLVRGILHVNCNSLLGRLERNPWLISEHVRSYLDKPPAQEALRSRLELPRTKGGARRSKHRTIDDIEYRWCNYHEDWHELSEWSTRTRESGGINYRCLERKRELRKERRAQLGLSPFERYRTTRDRKIAEMLSEGHTGREVAKLTGLSPARISQISKELRGDMST